MPGKPWTLGDERFINEHAGQMNMRQMADALGRSHESVRYHVHVMRMEGRLDKPVKVEPEITYVSDLTVCTRCYTPRTSVDAWGVCKVCRAKDTLEANVEKMHKAYENLPQPLKERTNGTFRIQRNPALMTKSRGLRRPAMPDTSGMDAFYADAAIDRWNRETEDYELAMLQLDIDAVKQRVSKWRRKAQKYRSSNF